MWCGGYWKGQKDVRIPGGFLGVSLLQMICIFSVGSDKPIFLSECRFCPILATEDKS